MQNCVSYIFGAIWDIVLKQMLVVSMVIITNLRQ